MRRLAGGQVVLSGIPVMDDVSGTTSFLDGRSMLKGSIAVQVKGKSDFKNAYELHQRLNVSGTILSETSG